MSKDILKIEVTGSTEECLRIQEFLDIHGWKSTDEDKLDFHHGDGTTTRAFSVEVPASDTVESDAKSTNEVILDDEYCEEGIELNDRLLDEVYPILNELEQDYPEHSAYFSMFINLMYNLFYQGWTTKELIEEVEEHYLLFVQEEFADLQPHELQ